jgi:hypothetical protein
MNGRILEGSDLMVHGSWIVQPILLILGIVVQTTGSKAHLPRQGLP